MRVFLSLMIVSCFLQAQGADKYTDGNRPYEFGFTVDGEQHRHEKKDEKGIIMGEFGFITADGVYHVTVYATDEEGHFKIISMKNIRVKPYPTAPELKKSPSAISLPPPQQSVTTTPKRLLPEITPPLPGRQEKSCSHCSLPTPKVPPTSIAAAKGQLGSIGAQSSALGSNNQYQPIGAMKQYSSGQQINFQNRNSFPEAEDAGNFATTNNASPQQGLQQGLVSSLNHDRHNSNVNQNNPVRGGYNAGHNPTSQDSTSNSASIYSNEKNYNNPVQKYNINTGNNNYFKTVTKTEQSDPGASAGQNSPVSRPLTHQNYPASEIQLDKNSPDSRALINQNYPESKTQVGQNYPESEKQFSHNSPGSGALRTQNYPESETQVGQNSPGSEALINKNYPGSRTQVGQNNPVSRPQDSQKSPGLETLTNQNYPESVTQESQNSPGSGAINNPELVSQVRENYPNSGTLKDQNYPESVSQQSQNYPGTKTPSNKNYPVALNSAGKDSPQRENSANLQNVNANQQHSFGATGTRERNPKQYRPNEGTVSTSAEQPFNSQSTQGPSTSSSSRPVQKPTLISAQMRIVDKNTDVHKKNQGEKEGLPDGLNQNDMMRLLYTFNYTVGFHGHHEEGYSNGAKVGYYYVTGRNGVRTRVDYEADENGFRPKITQEILDLVSDEVPKPETEKEEKFGLKSYEFKWLYFPVESKS